MSSRTGGSTPRRGRPAGSRSRGSREDLAAAHHHGAAADLGGHERTILDHHLQANLARTTHLDALLNDDVVLAFAQGLALHESTGEGRSGRSGSRIFSNSHAQTKHTGAEAQTIGL